MFEIPDALQKGRAIMEMGQRYEERIRADVPLHLTSIRAGKTEPSWTRNLSPSGALVETGVLLEPGELIHCRFNLPNSKRVFAFFASVVREETKLAPKQRDSTGFGVEFIDTSPLDRIEIRSKLNAFTVSVSPSERAWFI